MQQTANAYILQVIPFQEKDAIVRLLDPQSGRQSGVVKGAYNTNRQAQKLRASLQTGSLIEYVYTPTRSMLSISKVDGIKPLPQMSSVGFVFLSYVHELLLYLLPDGAGAECFSLYQSWLADHSTHDSEIVDGVVKKQQFEQSLRFFELALMDLLGHGVDFTHEAHTHQPIAPDQWYEFIPETGFVSSSRKDDRPLVRGDRVLAIAEGTLHTAAELKAARYICRLQINYLLQGRTLKSRQLFAELFGKTAVRNRPSDQGC